jgi:hypothetical protein
MSSDADSGEPSRIEQLEGLLDRIQRNRYREQKVDVAQVSPPAAAASSANEAASSASEVASAAFRKNRGGKRTLPGMPSGPPPGFPPPAPAQAGASAPASKVESPAGSQARVPEATAPDSVDLEQAASERFAFEPIRPDDSLEKQAPADLAAEGATTGETELAREEVLSLGDAATEERTKLPTVPPIPTAPPSAAPSEPVGGQAGFPEPQVFDASSLDESSGPVAVVGTPFVPPREPSFGALIERTLALRPR